MTNGSSDTYEELFTYACPKFVSPAGPDFANPAANTNMEAFRAQLRWAACEDEMWAESECGRWRESTGWLDGPGSLCCV